MTDTNTRAAELGAHLARFAPMVGAHRIARFVTAAQSLARRAKAHGEAMCSDSSYVTKWSEPETGEDLRAAHFEREAEALLAELDCPGVTMAVGGDPRGPCLMVKLDGVRGDGWAPEDGFAVY